jgi:hypothetical protein
MNAYSLNLSKRYVSNWGAWEVAREVICNALDAAPEDMQFSSDGPNHIKVITPTNPRICDLLIMGEGSKSADGSTIGQFGEGLKLACLVATRSGGNVSLKSNGKHITFDFRSIMGTEVLHAIIEDVFDGDESYTCEITMPGIGNCHVGKILTDAKEGPLPKTTDEVRVYSHGVWICNIGSKSLWDWNLNSLKINRDRSLVSQYDVAYAVSCWLDNHGEPEHFDTIINTPNCVEATDASQYMIKSARGKLAEAFTRIYGEKAVISSKDARTDNKAINAGYRVVNLPDSLSFLKEHGIKDAYTCLPPEDALDAIDVEPYLAKIKMIRAIVDKHACANLKVCVFEGQETMLGMAQKDDNTIWLNKILFEGSDRDLLSTYIHEQAHMVSKADDGTVEFEYGLDRIAGSLAYEMMSVGV